MAVGQKHHRTLTDGVGKCSVPMWMGGCPAGFCDQPAYGEPTTHGQLRYEQYVPALACWRHGGPMGPRTRVETEYADED